MDLAIDGDAMRAFPGIDPGCDRGGDADSGIDANVVIVEKEIAISLTVDACRDNQGHDAGFPLDC
jgi:hypothetical protein